MSTPTRQETRPSQARGVQPAVLVLVAIVALIGTGLAWSIVQQPATAEITRRGEAAPAGLDLKIDPAAALKLIAQGDALVQSQCAGCHASAERLAGPSWNAIAERTRAQIQRDPFCGSGLALVANAVRHPAPGWDGYPAGPPPSAWSDDERIALAVWILKPDARPESPSAKAEAAP